MRPLVVLWIVGLATATPAAAQDLALEWPLDCTLGDTCHIQQYVDRDPGPGAADFTCGPLVYDAHTGTDIALPSRAAQAAGVTVRAAADGIVRGVRNDMADVLQSDPGAPDVTDVECGNGVVIAHPGGWETQYCHMAFGSVTVRPDQTVAAGDALGQVGLSGNTEFPHLHIAVRRDGANVDPFDPDDTLTCDGATARALWSAPVAYAPGGLIAAGFSDAVPDYAAIKDGAAGMAPARGAALVLWGYLYGGRADDVVRLSIDGPGGEVIVQDAVLERTQAQLFRAAGRRSPPGGWPAGAYVGTVDLIRDGTVIDSLAAAVAID